MNRLLAKGATLILVIIALAASQSDANGQWEDRSDETFDPFDSGNHTTWILVGAGVAVTGAVVAYTLRKQNDARPAEESKQNEEETTAMVHPFSAEPSGLQQLVDAQRSRPVNVLLGLRPSDQRPILGLSVRF